MAADYIIVKDSRGIGYAIDERRGQSPVGTKGLLEIRRDENEPVELRLGVE